MGSKKNKKMRRDKPAPRENQILLFEPETGSGPNFPAKLDANDSEMVEQPQAGKSVVLCGTYRKDPEGLRRIFEKLQDTGFTVLSPKNPIIENEEQGFVYMRNETGFSPEEIERRHLDAIQRADFVWFFAPDGYVGPTGALEVGFARANGIPIYSDTPLKDLAIGHFIERVDSPLAVHNLFAQNQVLPPQPGVRRFQHYYRQAAIHRGYTSENAKDCLMLMMEEVGELARALRKRFHITRHGKTDSQEALELADVFIYVVHMANILKIDLPKAVQDKELLNIKKFLHAK